MSIQAPVIIIGAGITGLSLAQALKKASIPFEIYERDQHFERAAGWGLTISWALPFLCACLPSELQAGLPGTQVDPQQGMKDTGRFLFLDLSTAEPKFVVPPSERLRVNRKNFRALLAEGLDVQWGRGLSAFKECTDGRVKVTLTDGTSTMGSFIVGADGSNSLTRRLLLGQEKAKLYQLPVRFMGTTVKFNPSQIQPLLDIDPLLFQGSHPDTGTFMWFSTLSTPEVNGSIGQNEYYEVQLNLSWIPKSPSDEIPSTSSERLAKMKEMAEPFEASLRKAIEDIPDGSEVLEIRLQDWAMQHWDSHDGRITLIGDAAHAMTMYRGDAANQGISDAANLAEQLLAMHQGKLSQKDGIELFESQMKSRAQDAVLLSRQACLDAHDLKGLHSDSPVVSKRAKVIKPISARQD